MWYKSSSKNKKTQINNLTYYLKEFLKGKKGKQNLKSAQGKHGKDQEEKINKMGIKRKTI